MGSTLSTAVRWFVDRDDLDQIVLITTNEPPLARVLVKGGYAPAATDINPLPPAR